MIALPAVALSLRWRGFRATQSTLQRLKASQEGLPPDNQRVAVTAQMVRAAVRHGFGHPSCLEESLTLWWLLVRQGISCEVRIGVRNQSEAFEAHAWVERNGVALNEPEARHLHYAKFESDFPASPETR
jgi:Transglutaminase-like superfamily